MGVPLQVVYWLRPTTFQWVRTNNLRLRGFLPFQSQLMRGDIGITGGSTEDGGLTRGFLTFRHRYRHLVDFRIHRIMVSHGKAKP